MPADDDRREIIRPALKLCSQSQGRIGRDATDSSGRTDAAASSNILHCRFRHPSEGRYLHSTEDRFLSYGEGARLRGVPNTWTFAGRPYPVARWIGNGVPTPLAAAVGRAVAAAL